jgi:hypothetical protein
MSEEQSIRVCRERNVAKAWEFSVGPTTRDASFPLQACQKVDTVARSWDRPGLVTEYQDYLDLACEGTGVTFREMSAYKNAIANPDTPVDLGMLRWIHETRGIRFRFLCVRDKHPAAPVLVQCGGTAHANSTTSRHADLAEGSGPVVDLLTHQVGSHSNVVFTRLMSRGPTQPPVVPVVDPAWECHCLHDRPFPFVPVDAHPVPPPPPSMDDE